MASGFFLFMRRLRRPLLALIVTYSLCTLGFVLIPATDEQGRPVTLDFLHAFYVVSYTATTIGFGELPYPFNAAQRMWMVFTIYATVTVWLYAIGAIIATLQDPALRQVIGERRFQRAVHGLGRPFYLLCGYGDTGVLVVRELMRYRIAAVVIDADQEKLDELSLQDLGMAVPALRADASRPQVLIDAGLTSPWCLGVLALTGSDDVNLSVAMSARLLNPKADAICRTYSADTAANMASFGTRHIVNPFVAFADRLGLTFRAPSAHVVYECLTTSYRAPTAAPLHLPRGLWVVCGYGRFGKAVCRQLQAAGNEVAVIEADPIGARPPEGAVIGRGTEAETLLQAGLQRAVGIVAGTDNGINNLSVIVTARELNADVFTVARQTRRYNSVLFRQAPLDLRVQTAHLAASEAVELLLNRLLPRFLDLLMRSDEDWAAALLARMAETIGNVSPATWVIDVRTEAAPALSDAVNRGHAVPVGLLTCDPRQRDRQLRAMPLLLCRRGQAVVLPGDGTLLQSGDEILFCGRPDAEGRMAWAASNIDVLSYLRTGIERPSGWIWRYIARRRSTPSDPGRHAV